MGSMTPLSQIEALLKEWREQAERHKKHGDSYRIGQGWGMVQCADELDALLASLREAGAEPQGFAGLPVERQGFAGLPVSEQAGILRGCADMIECKTRSLEEIDREATGDPAPPEEKD